MTLLRHSLSAVPRAAACLLAASSAAASDLIVVDTQGAPVAGIGIELVTRPVGAYGPATTPSVRVTDKAGRAPMSDDVPGATFVAPLDFASNDPSWAIQFVHGQREVDEAAGLDFVGNALQTYGGADDIVIVVERLGTVVARVHGAAPSDRFHWTFMDERPEPESHRPVRVGGTFTGATGELRVPVGRGTLYMAREDFLGTPVLGEGGPVIVSVTAGGSSEIGVSFLPGPLTPIQAPFERIPFANVEALAPDGVTVIGLFPFERSPLRLPSAIPVATRAGDPDPAEPRLRLPRHLVRAKDIPIQIPGEEPTDRREAGTPDADGNAIRVLENAPMELTFSVDPGRKLRLPEMSGGWIERAKEGAALLAGPMGGFATSPDVRRGAPGAIEIASTGTGAAWTGVVEITDDSGEPQPYCEVLVAVKDMQVVRSIAGADGVLSVSGLRSDAITVARLDAIGTRATLLRPEPGTNSVATIGGRGASVNVTAGWKDLTEAPPQGTAVVLAPAEEAETEARKAFQTRSVPFATVDAKGVIDFGSVPSGVYSMRTSDGGSVLLDLNPDGNTSVTIELSGKGKALAGKLTER